MGSPQAAETCGGRHGAEENRPREARLQQVADAVVVGKQHGGSLALGDQPIERHAGAYMFGGVALFGVCTIVFALSRNVALSLAALLVLGSGDMLSIYVRGILVQLNTPDSIRGRVSAINSMFIGGSNELGEFESGVTARWFGAAPAAVLGGVLTLAVVAGWIGMFPALRKLDRLR